MPSTRSASKKPSGKAHRAKPQGNKGQASAKAKPSSDKEGESDDSVRVDEAGRPGLNAMVTVESIEKAIAEKQRELARFKARTILERRMAALAEEIDLLNDKKGAVPEQATTIKPSASDKKAKKRARAAAAAAVRSESESSDSSADELDLGTDDDSSEDSETENRRKARKLAAKTAGTKLSPKLTLRHWRRQAKTLGANGQSEMKVLLRILQGQRKVISQSDVKALAFELQLLYLKHTDGTVVAERFRINTSSAEGNGQDGALDQKQVRLAQKQSVAVLAPQVPKNEGGGLKTQRARKKTGNQQQPWNKWLKGPSATPRPTAPEVRCFKCDKLGHRAAQCLQKSKGEKDGNKSA